MNSEQEYFINTDIRYNSLEIIDIPGIIESCREEWFNQSLCRVNDCVVRLGKLHGEFHWHKHDEEDEFFYVIEGLLLIDLEYRTVELTPQQGFTVPKGVNHRTRAPQCTTILMVEGSEVNPIGN
ncbi:MAG: cupin domain-containing protein [Candidatus Electryonea clarkiae]|nr:cupin domain-containing protein [Candidatus Electryonea clarkiae]MDP8287124.1 cupin domain-containing protein [Candidatus Electryonea clarkiae]